MSGEYFSETGMDSLNRVISGITFGVSRFVKMLFLVKIHAKERLVLFEESLWALTLPKLAASFKVHQIEELKLRNFRLLSVYYLEPDVSCNVS